MEKQKKDVDRFQNLFFLLKIFNLPSFRLFSIFLLFIIIISSLMPLLSIELTKRLLNAIQLGKEIETILSILFFMIAMQTIQKLINTINNYLTGLFQLRLNNYVTELIMKKISMLKFEELFSSVVIDKLYFLRTTSTMKIGSIFSSSISMFSNIITFISIFIYLFNWIPLYAILVAICSIPVGIVQLYFNNKNFILSKNINKFHREQFYLLFISTTPESLKEITQYSSMSYIVESYQKIFKKIYNPTKSLSLKVTIATMITSLLGVLAIGYSQYKTILLVFEGQILIGTLMSILQSLGIVFQRMQGLIMTFGGFHNDWLYVNNLRDFLSIESSKNDSRLTNPVESSVSITAKNLTYCVDGVTIFENLNFHFSAGSIIGIMGENGTGKSTLLDIIQGLKKQTSGELYFNDMLTTDILDTQRVKLCQTLLQNPVRYELSLSENVGIADSEKYRTYGSDILEYIYHIDKESFVFDNNIKKETLLGNWYDESHPLSGGQWQRLALYRLLYRNTPIYLIDEPTNNLDENALYLLEDFIKSLSKENLVIIISHNTNFLSKNCSQIYTMSKQKMSLQEKKISINV